VPEDKKLTSRSEVSADLARKIYARLEELGGSPARVGQEFNCSTLVVAEIFDEFTKNRVADAGKLPETKPVYAFPVVSGETIPFEDEPQDLKKSENSKGEMELTFLASKECVKTLDDMVKAAGVDLATWYVHDWEATAWTTPMKVRRRGEEKPLLVQCHRVKMSLRRIVPMAIQDGLDRLYARMASHAPKYPAFGIRSNSLTQEDILGVFCLFDVHFGKLAWDMETGNNFDIKIAERFFSNAVEDLFERSKHRSLSRVLIPIGNDFFHVNSSLKNETAAGTVQDQDGRYAKMVEAGEIAFVNAIDRIIEECPVDVVLVPGNHAPTAEYHTARFLHAWYSHKTVKNRVTVDYSPNPRKYYEFGATLIGLTHGNEEKHDALPGLMANERPDAWARSKCRHWYIGHYHQAKKYQTKPLETRDGVEIRIIRSLAGNDAWHHKKGYLNMSQAAEAYFHGRESGYLGHEVAYARNGSLGVTA